MTSILAASQYMWPPMSASIKALQAFADIDVGFMLIVGTKLEVG